MPKQMSKEEVALELKAIMDKSGLNTQKDMGPLMGLANKKLAGKSDGKTIAAVLKSLLQ
jgi:uncharacterized protein YqeY